ncbi:MAG: site-specific integrase, partial [Lachnospiraceae bacterium]|nr:site-specific integrase [Lachnospiraceae bacterium]
MIVQNSETHTYFVYGPGQDDTGRVFLGEFKTRQEARDFELKTAGFEACEQNEAEYDNITFEQLVDRFLEEKRVRVRESTFIGYNVIAQRFIRPCFKKKRIGDITPADLRAWQNGMLQLDYSPLYLHRVDSVMATVFKYGVRFFGLKNNPYDRVGSIGEGVAKKVNFWTLEEFRQFMTAVKSSRNRLMFELLYWTGMRLGELLALTASDIDLENGIIYVTKTYRRYHGRDIISPPKTRKSRREVYINPSLVQALKSYICSQYGPAGHNAGTSGTDRNACASDTVQNVRTADAGAFPDTCALAPATQDADDIPSSCARLFPVGFDSVRDALTRAARKAGVKRIKIHDLRHSHASLLINMNVTPLLVSERLG